MKVFNEENLYKGKPTQIVLILELKEAQTLIDMCTAACEANKRKKTWAKVRDFFFARLDCF